MKPSASKAFATPGCPDTVAGLDLARHGLLEASAGTGKTYAIEHLVLRLLLESDGWELPQILVLTFTEKAAGELKEKIRARIAWRIAQGGLPDAALGRLRDAHLSFDRAAIHTIHGFCQRVLRNYAFENNALFRLEVVTKEDDLLEEALLEEMRSTWIAGTGDGPEGLQAFRDKAAAIGLGPRSQWSKWDKKLLRIAKEFNPARGDVLLPAYDPADVAAAEEAMLAAAAGARDLVDASGGAGTFLARYGKIRFANGTLKKKAPKVVEAALGLAAAAPQGRSREARVGLCLGFLESLNLRAVDESFAALMPAPEECDSLPWPELEALIARLDDLRAGARRREAALGARAYGDQRQAVLGLRDRVQAFKRSRGLLGFNDMIEGVHAALRDRPGLERVLRQEYRCCLVDEFQDTDPLQWSIFRRIFLESRASDGSPTHPLFLIGDPKQAIYRFRGGDIHTYMDARRDLQELARQGWAQGISLDVNYRSHAGMVEACNTVFGHARWFHALEVDPGAAAWKLPATPDPLGYLPVKAGRRPVQECEDRTAAGRPIVFRDFAQVPGGPDKQAVERGVAAWITAEIGALMADPERLRIPDKATGAMRPLGYGDICILAKTNREKERLEKSLARAGIPFQVDKRTGLWAGNAAGQFLAVLEALEDPRDAGKQSLALMTRFFRPAGDPPPPAAPAGIHPRFDEWNRLAERREWQRLFHSLLYGTGLLHRESLEEDGDRRIMDFLHIAQSLVLDALSHGHSLPALVQRLRDRRLEGAAEDEEDYHREESEGGKVILMTMHSSKGLEFPVVLLASFTGPPQQSYLKYRDGERTVYNLATQDAEGRAAFDREAADEERRLFYVAFTRARFKLYVPLLPARYARSESGPLGGFAAEAVRAAAAAREDLFHRVGPAPGAAPEPEGIPEVTMAPAPAPLPDPAEFFSGVPAGDPFEGRDADFSARRLRLDSYSHLARQGGTVAAEELEGRFFKDEVDEVAGGLRAGEEDDLEAAPDAPGNALPRGKEIGNMFHEILEEIDFRVAAAAASPEDLLAHRATADLLSARMAERRLEETHRGDVARVLWHTLRARIPDAGAPGEVFRLGDVHERRHELEFLFPYPPAGEGRAGGRGNGFLWGFIDLVFRRDDRYYLLDWKSNWLDEYGPAALERNIRESRYDLQYMLYSLALDRWLASVKRGYDFGKHFGGVYYIYLRGMRGDALPTVSAGAAGRSVPGAFGFRPSADQVRGEFAAAVDLALGRPHAAAARMAKVLTGEDRP